MRFDNIHKGDYVAVIGTQGEWPEPSPWMAPQTPANDGDPMLVMEVSWPFLAVARSDGTRHSIDTRYFLLTKVSKKYADTLAHDVDKRTKSKIFKQERLRNRQKPKKERPDGTQCPRCGDRMIQRHFMRPIPAWHRFCSTCAFDAGPVDPEDKGRIQR